jgi:hypothetical protein
VIDISPQARIETSDKNVYTEVKLEVVDEHRVMNVSGSYKGLAHYLLLDILQAARNEDSFSLRLSAWLHDPNIWRLPSAECVFELSHLLWQYISLGSHFL